MAVFAGGTGFKHKKTGKGNATGSSMTGFSREISLLGTRVELRWAPPVTEDTAYRQAEFRRLMKSFKASFEPPAPQLASARCTYTFCLHQENLLFPGHQEPENDIQVMVFGTHGYLSHRFIHFTARPGDETILDMQDTWEGPYIGSIEAIGLGYDHGSSNSLFLEFMTLQVEPEDASLCDATEYLIPIYRWISSQRDDGASYRIAWANPTNECVFLLLYPHKALITDPAPCLAEERDETLSLVALNCLFGALRTLKLLVHVIMW